MDITHFNGQRDRAWAVNMINLEAGKLTSLATKIGDYHLKDGLTRLSFLKEVQQFIEKQFAIARTAKSSEALLEPFKALREESEHLQEQDRTLRLKIAKVYAQVEIVRDENKIVGYIITGVTLILGVFSIVAGLSLFATLHPVGMVAGAVLVIDGFNTISKEIVSSISGDKKYEGMVADEFISMAKFLGFSPKVGLATYKTISLAANTFNVFGLLKKKGTFSLFRHVPRDFYRNADKMSSSMLTIKVVGFGLEAKAIIGVISASVEE